MATAAKQWRLPVGSAVAAAVIGGGWSGVLAAAVQASAPQAAPAEVQRVVTGIAAAASDRDLEAVMAFYSPSFASDTDVDYARLQATLETLWQQYPDITYTVELLSWQGAGPGNYSVETRTTVTGIRALGDRTLTLTADITSRQRIEGGQVAYQEILSETGRLVAGANPPTLQVQLPTTVSPGQRYSFDTVVLEPLESRILMGVAVEEGVTSVDFFEPRPVVFDILSSGGLYKVGTAPDQPDQRWVSSVVIREDGLVVETRRLRVESPVE